MGLIETGKIVNTHGIRGELKIMPWSNDINSLLDFESFYIDNVLYNVESSRIHKNMLLIKFENIDSINEAELFKNKVLFAEESLFELEEDVYFIRDLYDIMVYNIETNEYYGKITEVLETGANDVYEITDDNGEKRLIPAIEDCIKSTDIENKIMKILPLEGLFEI